MTWTRNLPAGAVDVETRADGVVLYRLGLYGNLDFSIQSTLNFLEDRHRESPFDLVWGHYLFPSGFVAVWAARTLGLPSLVSARGNDVDRLVFPPGDFARLEWTLRHADRVTAVSRDMAAKIRVLLGAGHPVEVLGNAVDSKVFQPGLPDPELRMSLGIAPNEKVLLFCGELRQKKGLPFLLKALSDVRAVRPACLLVLGEMRAQEQSEIQRWGAEHPEDQARLLVTGHLEDPDEVARHLRLGDLFLLPSLWDGLPNALLEAMACGRVCLTSDAGGLPEVLETGVNGWMIPKGELHRLGEAALELLALPEDQRSDYARAARETVLECFSPERERRLLQELLLRLQESGDSSSS